MNYLFRRIGSIQSRYEQKHKYKNQIYKILTHGMKEKKKQTEIYWIEHESRNFTIAQYNTHLSMNIRIYCIMNMKAKIVRVRADDERERELIEAPTIRSFEWRSFLYFRKKKNSATRKISFGMCLSLYLSINRSTI